MDLFNYKTIGDMNLFRAEGFPVLSAEVNQVIKDVHHAPIYFKSEMIISYLKNHSLKKEWIAANPVLAKSIISGMLVTHHIEQLFEACRHNKPFQAGFEKHLRMMFS